MNDPATTPPTSSPSGPSVADSPANQGWLAGYPWAPYVLPLAVYMAVGTLEPTRDKPFELLGWTISFDYYPAIYTIKLLATMAVLAVVARAYRQFPLRVSPLAPVVGLVGVVLWIGLCEVEATQWLLAPLGLADWADAKGRPAFNPFELWPEAPAKAYGFLTVRFWGLAILVPLVEEMFIRGFVMRFVVAADWWKVPFGTFTPLAAAAGTLTPLLTHPLSEAVAVLVWFTLVLALMFKTKNIWDCVVAHSVTNLLLGIYVVASGHWYLW
jgi:CAAX prenyl protease-like protein